MADNLFGTILQVLATEKHGRFLSDDDHYIPWKSKAIKIIVPNLG